MFTKFGCNFLRILVFVALCTAVRHLLDTVFTLKQDAIFVVFFSRHLYAKVTFRSDILIELTTRCS